MLEILSLINSWIWNILGIFVGLPLVLCIGFSIIVALFAGVSSIVTVSIRK